MLRINGLSHSSPSPSYYSSPNFSLQDAPHDIKSPRDHHLLNSTPKPSYHCNPAVHMERTSLDQSSFCWASDKERCFSSSTSVLSNCTYTKKSSAELMKEITILEVEITHMERYLLSLYRAAFEQHIPSLPEKCGTHIEDKIGPELQAITDKSCLNLEPNFCKGGCDYQNQTSPVHGLTSSDDWNLADTPKSSSKKDRKTADPGHRSLADHLGASLIDNIRSPDKLSEDIVRCLSSILCRLANPGLTNTSLSVSSNSSLSSSSTFSPRNLSDSWSPHFNEATGSQFQSLKEDNGPYAAMIEVLKISLDDDSFNYAARMLQNFSLLVKGLEKVDPGKMTREEKLAFWINIHNALVMHAHLAYGSQNYVKSTSILKAAYSIGGHCVNAYIIQSSILGMRSHFSGPWLETLLSPGKKFKAGNTRHVYAIEYPEPLVHFALCSGVISDPAVRVYSSKNVFKELELAKDEFIQASVYIHKESKICLPKILYYFAKDMSLTVPGLVEIVYACLSEVKQRAMRRCMKGRPDKYISWLSQSSAFRYLIDRKVVKGRLSV